jgi:hypothetical protein
MYVYIYIYIYIPVSLPSPDDGSRCSFRNFGRCEEEFEAQAASGLPLCRCLFACRPDQCGALWELCVVESTLEQGDCRNQYCGREVMYFCVYIWNGPTTTGVSALQTLHVIFATDVKAGGVFCDVHFVCTQLLESFRDGTY